MKPEDLLGIETLKATDLTADVENPFVRVWRYLLRNKYTNDRISQDYPFDMAVTRFCDGVAVVPYYREASGKFWVGLRHGTRPTLFLRGQHVMAGKGSLETGISVELVAGGVEKEDYQGEGIAGRAAEELWEEAGFRVSANKLIRLGASAFTATGFAIEKMHYFCAEVKLSDRKENSTEENPHEAVGAIEFVELSDALTRCRQGKIADQKTEVGLFRFASHVGIIPEFGLAGDNKLFTDKQLDLMARLHQRSWESFDERRRHDYKISVLVWGIFLATAAFLLKLDKSLLVEVKLGLTVGLGLLAVLYVRWNLGAARMNRLDRRMAIFYGDKLMKSCGTYDEFYRVFDPAHNRGVLTPVMGKMTFGEYFENWNHRVCVYVTGMLTLAAIAIVWFAVETREPTQSAKPTNTSLAPDLF